MKEGNRSKHKSKRPVRPNVEDLQLKKRLRKLFETKKISKTAASESVQWKQQPTKTATSTSVQSKQQSKSRKKKMNSQQQGERSPQANGVQHQEQQPMQNGTKPAKKPTLANGQVNAGAKKRMQQRRAARLQLRKNGRVAEDILAPLMTDDMRKKMEERRMLEDQEDDGMESDNSEGSNEIIRVVNPFKEFVESENEEEDDDDDEDEDDDDDDDDYSMDSVDSNDSDDDDDFNIDDDDTDDDDDETDDDMHYGYGKYLDLLYQMGENDHDDDNDEDYQLPEHVQNDLIIHQGTASKRALQPEDNVQFDSEDDEPQIVELHATHEVQCVAQPGAYERDELVKLYVEERKQQHSGKEEKKTNDNAAKNNECPRLWSRDDVKRFRTENDNNEDDNDNDDANNDDNENDSDSEGSSESDSEDDSGADTEDDSDSDSEDDSGADTEDDSGSDWNTEDDNNSDSDYEQCSDDESIISIGIQERYMQRSSDDDDDFGDHFDRNYKMNAHVIDFLQKLRKETQKQLDMAKKNGTEDELHPLLKVSTCTGCIVGEICNRLIEAVDRINERKQKQEQDEIDILSAMELEEWEEEKEADLSVPVNENETKKNVSVLLNEEEKVDGLNEEEEEEDDEEVLTAHMNEKEAEEKEENLSIHMNKDEEEEDQQKVSPVHIIEEREDEKDNEDKVAEESENDLQMYNDEQETSALINESYFEESSFTLAPSAVADSIFCNAVNGNFVLALLKAPIYLYGTLRVQLLAGRIEVYGHTLRVGSPVEVFSPRGCSVVDVRPLQQSDDDAATNVEKLTTQLSEMRDFFVHRDLNRMLAAYQPETDAVLLLERNTLRQRCVNNFKRFMNENVFPNLSSAPRDRVLYESESLLQCFINTAPFRRVLQCPEEWYSLPLSTQTRLMLVGGKSVGKSTLLRWLVNRHLSQASASRVLVIDLDIGQSELFVPDTVSCFVLEEPLLGPGFFFNHQPAKAFFVGDNDIVLVANTYMIAVRRLLEYCHAVPAFKHMPWIINTMGYNKGFGIELFSTVAGYVQPTDVVQVHSNKAINNFDMALYAATVQAVPRCVYPDHPPMPLNYVLHELRSAVLQQDRYKQEWDMGPKDLRYAILLARLSDAVRGHADWFSDSPPCYVPVDQIQLWSAQYKTLTKEQLLQTMNCNLVFLCGLDDTDDIPECLGIGIFRGYDRYTQQVFVTPAMPSERLTQTNCLAFSKTTLPTAMYTNQGPKVRGIAPYVYNTIDANVSKAIKQMPFRPAAFLTGKHKELPR